MIKDYRDIPLKTKLASYSIDVSWRYLQSQLEHYDEYGLDLDPDFQRAHVWTKKQQAAYLEYMLGGGISGKDIYFNHPSWMRFGEGMTGMVIVDGKQRLQAVNQLLNNKIKIYGQYHKQFEGSLDMFTANFKFHINNLETRKQVLTWYLEFNSAGTAHTKKELDKVKQLLIVEQSGGSGV